TIPGGMTGAAAAAGTLSQTSAVTFTTGTYSTLGLQQLLAKLGYLPLTFTPADTGGATTASPASIAYAPPAGSFTFQPGYPTELTSQWKAGKDNILDKGAIRA